MNGNPGRIRALSPVQLSAVELIAEGKKDGEVAKALKVTRQTVNTWKNQNEDFKDAVDIARREIHGKARERLDHLSLKALDTLEKAVQAGSIPASLGVLRAYVSLVKPEDPPPSGKTEVIVTWCKDKQKSFADASDEELLAIARGK